MAASLSMGEAHRWITEYLNRFSDALSSQDPNALSPLLSASSSHTSPHLSSVADALSAFPDWPSLLLRHHRHVPLAADLAPHVLRSLHSFRLSRFVDAYNSFEKFANAFLLEFRNWETAWALRPMHTVAYEIRVLAERADIELASVGKNPEKLKGAGSFLMKVFGALAGKGPRRVGALYITCQLFKIYFKLGTVHLCRSAIRSIETARIFDFEEFPIRDKVTYMYYTGRLEVFNEDFFAADQKLMYALTHCDPQSGANIRFAVFEHVAFAHLIGSERDKLAPWTMKMILKYLIPVKLSLGILPKSSLLEKYNLMEYSSIMHALKQGDLRLLRSALQEHEDRFLRSGVYLVLEKLELQVYQRLVKRIYLIQKQKDPSKAHQVKLELIIKALKWLELDMDFDEVECIMSILIYKNLMKGYVAHKSKVVVLSKQDPFPKLNGKPVSS